MSTTRRSAGIVGLAVIGSRIMGLIREQAFAFMFGAGKLLDSFLAAFQIPNLLRDLFAEGALSMAFTTTFTKTWEKEGAASAWSLANLILSAMILFMGTVCLIGIALSPWIVQITSFGFHEVEGKFELTVQLTRMLFPFILFVSLAAVVMGILNARSVFGLPASASTIFNITSIIGGITLAFIFEPQADWHHLHFGHRALYGATLGVLLGGVAQLAVQLPALWKQGYRWRWSLNIHDERLRQVWRLMWPSVIAGAAVQVNVLVNGMFASEIDGARSWLNCAFRLMQFPIGVFGVAIATVTLPAVARHHARDDLAAFGKTVAESLRLAFFFTLPAAVGLAVLAPEIIRVIYQHGNFSEMATLQTAVALRAFAVGLAGYAALKVVVPCFYALDRPRIPLMVSLFGIGFNIMMNLILVKVLGMGHVGLALTTGLLALLNFLQLAWALRRHVQFGSWMMWSAFLFRVGLAAAGSGLLAWWVMRQADRWFAGGFLSDVLGLALAIIVAAGAYEILAVAMRVAEAKGVVGLVRRLVMRPRTGKGTAP